MGQKVNPYGLRIGINKLWRSNWYASGKEYLAKLHEDLAIRKAMAKLPELANADISDIEIIRYPQRITLIVYTSKPGVLIGVKGANIEKLTAKLTKYSSHKILLKIRMINKPESNAQLMALHIARQLKQRSAWRRTLKMALTSAMKAGIQGVKIKLSGRLNGVEMTQHRVVKEGRIPLHTLRADVDYGFTESMTTYGAIGVKIWIFKGEIYKKEQRIDAGKIVKSSNVGRSSYYEYSSQDKKGDK